MPVTLKDVAKLASVSAQTVSNVVNGKRNVRPETRLRVLEACEELNYTPNAVARSLVTRKSRTIGLVVTNIRNPIYGEIVDITAEVAERYGYSVIVGNTKRDSASELRIVNLLLGQRVDGVLLASGAWDSTATELLQSSGIPVVRIHYHPKKLNTDYFGVDNCEGTRLATAHLISLGQKQIGFVNGPYSSISIQREQGYRDAMGVADLPVNEDWVVDGGFTREQAYRASKVILADKARPTAFVCASDLMAIGVMDAAGDLGLNVPDDLALVGFDDMFLASIRSIGLTTIRFNMTGLAEMALLRLLNKMSDEGVKGQIKYQTVLPELVIRRSSGLKPDC